MLGLSLEMSRRFWEAMDEKAISLQTLCVRGRCLAAWRQYALATTTQSRSRARKTILAWNARNRETPANCRRDSPQGDVVILYRTLKKEQAPIFLRMEELQKIDEDPLPRMGARSAATKRPRRRSRKNTATRTPQSFFREFILK